MRAFPASLSLLVLLGCGGPEREPVAATPPAVLPPRVDPAALAELTLALPPAGLRARAVTVGTGHACVLALDDEVRCWGTEDRIGGAPSGGPGIPVAVPGLHDVVAIDAGLAHTSALTSSGDVWSWGGADVGEIGDGSPLHRVSPTRARIEGATAIAASEASTCARLRGGEVRCWGFFPGSDGTMIPMLATPMPLAVTTSDALELEFDGSRGVALGVGGEVWQWGTVPTLGLDPAPIAAPAPMAGLGGVSSLASGRGFTCAALADGVSCWGTGRSHYFHTTSDAPNVPVRLEGLPGGARLAAGASFVCALASAETWCAGWGELVDASAGVWPLEGRASRIGALDGLESIDAGASMVCGIAAGSVRCVGWTDGIDVVGPPS